MSSKTILTRIVTPSNVLLEVNADIVIMPGELGMFGVLPLHSLLISNLEPGIVKVTLSNKILKYFVHSAIAEVTESSVNIITEFALDCSKLDNEMLATKIKNLENTLEMETDNNVLGSMKTELTRYKALQEHI